MQQQASRRRMRALERREADLLYWREVRQGLHPTPLAQAMVDMKIHVAILEVRTLIGRI